MIPGVVLSGGASSRMGGRPKALLPVGQTGETFLARIVRSLWEGGVDDVLLVTGYHDPEIGEAVRQLSIPVRVACNPAPERGQLSSLLVALEAIDRPTVGGMLVTLVDLPLVLSSTVRAVLDGHCRGEALIVRPERQGRHGHPVIFARALFDELRSADPHQGAKPVVHRHLTESLDISVDDDGAFTDVDTVDDYRRVFGVSLSDV